MDASKRFTATAEGKTVLRFSQLQRDGRGVLRGFVLVRGVHTMDWDPGLVRGMAWPSGGPRRMTGPVWTALARLAPRPGAAEVVAVAPLGEVADDAASWLVERAEAFVPGGWESWCVEESSGPVAVWLRRPADAAPGTAGRPKHPDA